MRHQTARVVFVACLAAASAAQAPNSSSRSVDGFAAAESASRSVDAGAAESASTAPRHGGGSLSLGSHSPLQRWAPLREESIARLESAPQETDYSLTGMFQSAHGVFMRERGRFEPMARFDLGSFPNQSIHHEPGSFDLLRAGFDANLPLVLSSEGYLKIGAYGHVRRYRMDNITTVSPVGELHDETLHAAGIKLGFGAFLDENLLLEVETHPGVWSDADAGLHHQDYDVPSHALLTVRAHEDLYWKVGARYNQTFKNAPWLPYLGVSWDITGMITPEGGDYGTGAWRLDVLLPEYIELSFWPTADTGFQLGTEIDGAEYHVRTSAATGNQRDNLRVQEFTAYLGMTHRMSDNFSFSAKAGAVIGGDYELTNGSSGFNIVEGSLSQGFFGSVSFGIDW